MSGEVLAAQIDSTLYRKVLGRFPSGITVITSMAESGPVGFTCQSFSALSIDPPLVMACVARTSTSWPLIRETQRFCINILADHHHDVSNAFARSGGDKFTVVDWHTATSDLPRISESVAWIECSLEAEVDGGDHTIIIGRVHTLEHREDARPLLYFGGAYARLAHE